MKTNNIEELNPLVLAYIGDAIYDVYIRDYLILKGYIIPKELQQASLKYVSATGQAKILDYLIKTDFFTSDEINFIKRSRNTKSKHKPRSCDVLTYKHATALEAITGYFYYKNKEKLEKMMEEIYHVDLW